MYFPAAKIRKKKKQAKKDMKNFFFKVQKRHHDMVQQYKMYPSSTSCLPHAYLMFTSCLPHVTKSMCHFFMPIERHDIKFQ